MLISGPRTCSASGLRAVAAPEVGSGGERGPRVVAIALQAIPTIANAQAFTCAAARKAEHEVGTRVLGAI